MPIARNAFQPKQQSLKLTMRFFLLSFCAMQMSNQTLTSSQSNRGTTTIQQLSQHKRSLSFNHHLSYNQYSGQGANGKVVSAAASLNNQVVNREKNDLLTGPGGRVSLNNVKGMYDSRCTLHRDCTHPNKSANEFVFY